MNSPIEIIDGRYVRIGAPKTGGTASVIKATDQAEGRFVAVKIFNGSATESVEAEVFNREQEALSRLQHPSIVKLLDGGRCSSSDRRYLVTEWVEGPTLSEHIRSSGLLTWEQFYRQIGRDVLDALCHAFERDVSHRDISPRNILISSSGPKIIDFGQAKTRELSLGLTVAGWKTPPYAPPEEDSGRFTLTRDPFGFAAIAVVALAGIEPENHDQLDEALAAASIDPSLKRVLQRALRRDPKDRFDSIVSFREALSGSIAPGEGESTLRLFIRLGSNAALPSDAEGDFQRIEDDLVASLNDGAAIRELPELDAKGDNRLSIETAAFRLIVALDSFTQDHLVIVSAWRKRFALDSLYDSASWLPTASFEIGPPNRSQRNAARVDILKFYEAFETALAATAKPELQGDELLSAWERVLEIQGSIEAARIPALPFTYVNTIGRRLVVTIPSPVKNLEGQVRTISRKDSKAWAFRGEIERVESTRLVLYSLATTVQTDEIPGEGLLEHDWSQTRRALQRQQMGLAAFRAGETPSASLRGLLLGTGASASDPQYAATTQFFDQKLDPEKKAIVSEFLASNDLLLIHGPPGTGKTKTIVEIIRQELRRNPRTKILLVAQTHVAIDHALAGVTDKLPDASIVRIVSGSKELGAAARDYTVEGRGQKLEADVERAARQYLLSEARGVGIDYHDVELGMRIADLVRLAETLERIGASRAALEEEGKLLDAGLKTIPGETATSSIDEKRSRLRAINEELESVNEAYLLQRSQLTVAREALQALGQRGQRLAAADAATLKDECDRLLSGENTWQLQRLIAIAEEWRLKFATSEDFRVAIIANARIVAGTCVGFCREAAASKATYDLCIVDEASKATTPELLLPLSRSKRAVLVGDHHQLPPFVEYALSRPKALQQYDLPPDLLKCQLFESLQRSLGRQHCTELTIQYRMRGAIGKLISDCFYEGKLTSGLEPDERAPFPSLALAGLSASVVWYDTTDIARQGDRERDVKSSYKNEDECTCIVDLLGRIELIVRGARAGTPQPKIAVISGYAAQIEILEAEIAKNSALRGLDVECRSVHEFQGREVDICIYSVTRDNPRGEIGFLSEWRHLNVALSRCRWHLVIVGSMDFCARKVRGDNPFRDVVRFVNESDDCVVKVVKK